MTSFAAAALHLVCITGVCALCSSADARAVGRKAERLAQTATGSGQASLPAAAEDIRIWTEFVSLLKDGSISEEHVRPAYAKPATMIEFLGRMRKRATWSDWQETPEVFRVGPRLHFVTKLRENGSVATYSFTFLTEGDRWYLEHFESIVLRLDAVGHPPVSTFPDLAESKKAWMRQENYWSQMVVIYRKTKAASGRAAALDLFRDGAGYLVQAKTWVPFYPDSRAFVLYLCWEQSRLHGNSVTLESLKDDEAVVSMDSVFLRLYRQTGHLRHQLPEAEYVSIFETIWRDRAEAAGWQVELRYEATRATLRFTKKAVSGKSVRRDAIDDRWRPQAPPEHHRAPGT